MGHLHYRYILQESGNAVEEKAEKNLKGPDVREECCEWPSSGQDLAATFISSQQLWVATKVLIRQNSLVMS